MRFNFFPLLAIFRFFLGGGGDRWARYRYIFFAINIIKKIKKAPKIAVKNTLIYVFYFQHCLLIISTIQDLPLKPYVFTQCVSQFLLFPSNSNTLKYTLPRNHYGSDDSRTVWRAYRDFGNRSRNLDWEIDCRSFCLCFMNSRTNTRTGKFLWKSRGIYSREKTWSTEREHLARARLVAISPIGGPAADGAPRHGSPYFATARSLACRGPKKRGRDWIRWIYIRRQ